MEKTIFRIVNKAKDGVSIRMKNGSILKMTWEEFNSIYKMSEDKLHCELTEEAQKKMDALDLKVNAAVMALRRIQVLESKLSLTPEEQAEKITNIFRLSSIVSYLKEEFPGQDVMGMIVDRLNIVVNAFGVGVKSRRQLRSEKPVQKSLAPKNATQSLGDFAALQELKKKFEEK